MAEQKVEPKVEPKAKKTSTPIPANIKQEMENAKKDRAAQTDYDSGEKARKESMGSLFAKGGKVSSASKRADGIAIRGKTRA